MISPDDELETVTLSFMVPPDQGESPAWHDLGQARARTSPGPRMHGALTAYGLEPFSPTARQELELFADQPLSWRIDKEEGSFLGSFQVAEGARFTPDNESFWSISIVGVAPTVRIQDEALDESPAHHERIESIAARANEATSAALRRAIETRDSDLTFFDAFSAVTAGAIDAVLRVIASAIPDEALTAQVVREGMIQTIDELLPTIIAERQAAPAEVEA